MALPNLAAPKHSMTVPSSGEVIDYRPYLVKEEKVLMIALESQDEVNITRALIDTIGSCTDGALNGNNLTPFDLEYVFLQLRSKSVGETTEIRVKCEKCEELNEVNINLAAIKPPKMQEKKEMLVKISNDLSIQMKYPTVADAMDAMKHTRNSTDDVSKVDQLFETIVASIDIIFYGDETLYAKDHTKKELQDFIESMNAQQFGALSGFAGDIPSVSTDIVFDCTNCGTHNERHVEGLQNFFS
jgi:phage FluMu protein Com